MLRLFLLFIALVSALPSPVLADAAPPAGKAPPWAFESSDIPVDPDYRFGALPNGMRYVIRHNERPVGTAIVRMHVAVGAFDEHDRERGFAHFLEHMAFKGSANVPEGEMIRLLERKGLAFGADTNASTGFDETVYKLDLPTAEPDMIDTALMLMRETGSNLSITPDAVASERGVILSEMRDRNTYGLRNYEDANRFFYPGARITQRLPIGTRETIEAATAKDLRRFYEREYVPQQVTLVIVGDFDVDAVEAMIRAHFRDWRGTEPQPQPAAGPVSDALKARTQVYIDPALSERVTLLRSGPWLDEPDSVAQRRENVLRAVGYGIVNRRLQRLSRQKEAPFRSAGFGTGNVFEAARSTRLIVDTVDGKWRAGLVAAARTYREALAGGFTEAEVAEQMSNLRAGLENAVASADTRTNAALAAAALALVDDGLIPSTPGSALERFNAMAPGVTPEAVREAMAREALDLTEPLIRFEGRKAPEGGSEALRATWQESALPIAGSRPPADTVSFAYTDFGPAGMVVADERDAALGIRRVRFANGVMLNIKRTEIESGKVHVSLALDGGDRLNTLEDPLVTQMVPWLDDGGLGKHSEDELQTLLAGRTVSADLSSASDSFADFAITTPADLLLQLQVLAAFVTDPGYRNEGEVHYRQQVNDWFARMDATPQSALSAAQGGIVSDRDPRFSLQPLSAYRALTFDSLRRGISGRLEQGAVEIGVVGDIEEDQAIRLVGETFGALPERELAFNDASGLPPRTFTDDRSRRIVRHRGPANQALVRTMWPTADDSDPAETMKLELLERVVRLELTEGLRERLGKSYSPGASSAPSRFWPGYGTFSIMASIDVSDVPAAETAIRTAVSSLLAAPVDNDTLERARRPLQEALANGLKTNRGWLSLVDRAQTQPERIARYIAAEGLLASITPQDLAETARRYLDPDRALEILVLPEGVAAPPDRSLDLMAAERAAR
jgi:zinc protease